MKKINNKGFTLIELVVVITIIGMIIAISMPNIIKIKNNAVEKIDLANRKTLENAAKLAMLDGQIDSDIVWTANDEELWEDYLDKWPEYPLNNKEEYKLNVITEIKNKRETSKIEIEPKLSEIKE